MKSQSLGAAEREATFLLHREVSWVRAWGWGAQDTAPQAWPLAQRAGRAGGIGEIAGPPPEAGHGPSCERGALPVSRAKEQPCRRSWSDPERNPNDWALPSFPFATLSSHPLFTTFPHDSSLSTEPTMKMLKLNRVSSLHFLRQVPVH